MNKFDTLVEQLIVEKSELKKAQEFIGGLEGLTTDEADRKVLTQITMLSNAEDEIKSRQNELSVSGTSKMRSNVTELVSLMTKTRKTIKDVEVGDVILKPGVKIGVPRKVGDIDEYTAKKLLELRQVTLNGAVDIVDSVSRTNINTPKGKIKFDQTFQGLPLYVLSKEDYNKFVKLYKSTETEMKTVNKKITQLGKDAYEYWLAINELKTIKTREIGKAMYKDWDGRGRSPSA